MCILSKFNSYMMPLMCFVVVLMLDDDMLISVPDLSFAFSVWKVTCPGIDFDSDNSDNMTCAAH